MQHVTAVCNNIREAGFYENPKRCIFFAERFQILGHMIDQDGVHPAPEKIPSVMDWAKHKNQKELQPFCGIVNIISQFFHYAATVTPTLTELT